MDRPSDSVTNFVIPTSIPTALETARFSGASADITDQTDTPLLPASLHCGRAWRSSDRLASLKLEPSEVWYLYPILQNTRQIEQEGVVAKPRSESREPRLLPRFTAAKESLERYGPDRRSGSRWMSTAIFGKPFVLAKFRQLRELIVETDLLALKFPRLFSFLESRVVRIRAVAKDLFKGSGLRLIQSQPQCVRPVHLFYSNSLTSLLYSCI